MAPPPPSTTLSPAEAWLPLPDEAWDAAHARHLLRRTGWTATPTAVERAVAEGLAATLDRLFPTTAPLWPEPPELRALRTELREAFLDQRQRDLPEAQRRCQRMEVQRKLRAGLQTLALDWLQHAREEPQAAFAKWVLFLSDVFVVAADKVKNPVLLHDYDHTIRTHALGPAPALAKAVSRSPAMIIYLDLQQSRRSAPNENFARELFELFVLGEGHYTERDIKEAARAFTGYRQRGGEFVFARRQSDSGRKTIFGQTGPFDGDAVIDLAYQQPAAARFLPTELCRFYLSTDPLPEAWITALSDWWRTQDFDLRALALRVFSSRAFYAPVYHGDFIKSPVQFYLGLLQDLQLDVLPSARLTLNALRATGQIPFSPPNVRGWVGGRQWINATTLAARRQTVRALIEGIPERLLNADELRAIDQALSAGLGPFFLPSERLLDLLADDPTATVQRWSEKWLAAPPPAAARVELIKLLDDASNDTAALSVALSIFLQSPDYHLC